MKKRLLLITRQAGAVAAFEPLLIRLKENNWTYDILAFGKSCEEWEKLGYSFNVVKISQVDDLKNYKLVLTGTSSEVKEDAFYWTLANKEGVPSVAFVDSWINYSERFTEQNIFDRTPDYIGLVDELMYRRMIENGAPVEKLVVLGHPRFDAIFQKFSVHYKKENETKKIKIVFFSDLVNGNNIDTFGYNSETVVKFVLNQILIESEHIDTKISVLLKPHPRENSADYEAIIKSLNAEGLVAISNETPLQLMGEADVVMGMNTILLIDSSLLGIPTYSFQPERNAPTNDITDRQNIHVITSWQDMVTEISNIILKKPARKKILLKKSYCSEKFLKFIELISNDSNLLNNVK